MNRPFNYETNQLLSGQAILMTEGGSISSFAIDNPSLKTFIAAPLFLVGSGIQHDCHEYLASLKKYSLPSHPVFQEIVCPHYTCECLIYLSIGIVSAPSGQMLNKTIFSALVLTTVNLGITADSSRKWYIEKFGGDKVRNRWRMVPFVF